MSLKRRLTIIVAAFIASWWGLDALHDHLDPNSGWKQEEENEEASWIASSPSAFDRAACRWLDVCGFGHIAEDPAKKQKTGSPSSTSEKNTYSNLFSDDTWGDGKDLKEIPQYVLDHAPLVHLYSGEQFWPCDFAEHLSHTTPHLNYTPISHEHPTPANLDQLNEYNGGRFVFLQSDDNVEDRPDWLGGAINIPAEPESQDDDDREAWADIGIDSTVTLGGLRPEPDETDPPIPFSNEEGDQLLKAQGIPRRRHHHRRLSPRSPQTHHDNTRTTNPNPKTRPSLGGRSSAPAILILVEKSPNITDAFWFYFYSYNLGNTVLNVRFGNHVGDWEHSLVRFQNGIPRAVFFSAHAGGKAYAYSAVEKIGLRPVIYSAEGSHAMYATSGSHPYILPAGLLKDVTDRGPLWDPALNVHGFWYDYRGDGGSGSGGKEVLRPVRGGEGRPMGWFWFGGHWGDKFYGLGDRRQYRFAKQYHYVNGPLGPRFKHLGRRRLCQGNGRCEILDRV